MKLRTKKIIANEYMTYKKAVLKRKKLVNEKRKPDDLVFDMIVVAPKIKTEMLKYMAKGVSLKQIINPIPFSSDNEFEVYGVKIETSDHYSFTQLS